MSSTSTSPASAQQRVRRARRARLIYINRFESGITRRRRGKGFVYLSPRGRPVSSRIQRRIDRLVIPPAWEDVWVCPTAKGHIQAVGCDQAGRRQYIYHAKWQALSSVNKYERLETMAELLPRIRRRLASDLKGRKLTKERVLAAVVRLIDKAHLRVGHQRYVEQNGSYGVTTLGSRHVEVDRFTISLDFPAKSGQRHASEFSDKKVAKVIGQCEEIDEQFLFCYADEHGEYQSLNSTDVNNYLREISGEDITAKDFRTWWGSVVAFSELKDCEIDGESATVRKRHLRQAVKRAAEALGNTQTVCRNCYIHPGLLTAFESGKLRGMTKTARRAARQKARGLTSNERLLAALLPMLSSS